MSCGVTWPVAHPRFLIGNGKGPCVCTVSLLNNCIGEGLTCSNYGIKIDSHRMAQVKSGADTSASMAYMPYSVYASVLVI